MTKENLIEKLYGIGIIPVVKITDPTSALPIAKALIEGHMPCVEVTYRSEYAGEAIKAISETYKGKILVGAGTVLNKEQVDDAIKNGAQFIVSPGFNPNIVKYCIEKNVPILPGCTTASQVEAAIELGLDVVKFFPAEASGGIKMIKALAGPFGNIRFMPTGGITDKNICDYLAFDKIVACGGSYMVTADIVKEKRFDEIVEICKRSIKTMLGLEIAHVGINPTKEESADNITKSLGSLMCTEPKVGNSSIFVGKDFEVMKEPYLGTNGHIAIAVNDIKRAISFFKANGYEFLEDTKKVNDKGQLMAIYFKGEIGGFAYHLVQKK